MLIALNIALGAVLVAGLVAFHLHAIRSEHRQRIQATGESREIAVAGTSADYRVASTLTPAPAA